MDCPICTTAMVETQATNHGPKYLYCRSCKMELDEVRQAMASGVSSLKRGPTCTCGQAGMNVVCPVHDGPNPSPTPRPGHVVYSPNHPRAMCLCTHTPYGSPRTMPGCPQHAPWPQTCQAPPESSMLTCLPARNTHFRNPGGVACDCRRIYLKGGRWLDGGPSAAQAICNHGPGYWTKGCPHEPPQGAPQPPTGVLFRTLTPDDFAVDAAKLEADIRARIEKLTGIKAVGVNGKVLAQAPMTAVQARLHRALRKYGT